MVLDSAGADQQLGPDLRVGVSVRSKARDLGLLGRERVTGLGRAAAHGLARREQLTTGALGEGVCAEAGKEFVRCAQLLTSGDALTLASKPLSIEQVRTGELDADPGCGGFTASTASR